MSTRTGAAPGSARNDVEEVAGHCEILRRALDHMTVGEARDDSIVELHDGGRTSSCS